MRLLLILILLLAGCARGPATPAPELGVVTQPAPEQVAMPLPAAERVVGQLSSAADTAFDVESLPQVSGTLTQDLELSGRVLLVDDLRVPAGRTLHIAAGTTLYVRPAESTKIDPEYLSPLTEILVQGELDITGTSQEPVEFLPLDPLDPVADNEPLWAGITVAAGGQAQLSGVFISRADSALLVSGSAQISDSRIRGSRYGLTAQHHGSLHVQGVQVSGGETGLFCWGGALLQLSDSTIENQDEEGLLLGDGCDAGFSGLSLFDSNVGIAAAVQPEGVTYKGAGIPFRRLFGDGR